MVNEKGEAYDKSMYHTLSEGFSVALIELKTKANYFVSTYSYYVSEIFKKYFRISQLHFNLSLKRQKKKHVFQNMES